MTNPNPVIDIAESLFFEDLSEGMHAQLSKNITEQDINQFAQLSGDTNPVHLDEAYAATTPFKTRIAHGSLCASFISAAFATRLPGPGCIYVSQNLRFKAPVFIGSEVVTKVVVKNLIPKKCFVEFTTQCFVNDALVLDGEATLMVPSRQR